MSAIGAFRLWTMAGALLLGGGAVSGHALLAVPPLAGGVIESDEGAVPPQAAPQEPGSDSSRSEAADKAPSGNPLWAIPLRLLSATREKPIFSPSRRPPPPAVIGVPEVKAAPPPVRPVVKERPQFTLVGTITGSERSIGIFVDQATKDAFRLRIDDNRNGWMLRELRAKEATLQKNGQTEILVFMPSANNQGAAAFRPFDPLAQLRQLRSNR